MKTICLITIAIILSIIAGKLDDISRKLDRPAFIAGEYRPNLRGSLQ